MDVHLLVYDLSRGIARQMSMQLLGFQLDAIYHTSIELNGREFVYDGGIVAITPGSSHLGRPLQRLPLGRTELPMDVISEYLDSLRAIFTVEAYDLWRHNCNNFSDSFAKFLLGHGIPDHILHMPQAVLDSPLGQMLMPQLNQTINATRQNGSILGIQQNGSAGQPLQTATNPLHQHQRAATVQTPSSLRELNAALDTAKAGCAVVFFTSATCPPCKALYPMYEELAAEVGDKGAVIKVDVSRAPDAGNEYAIRATPTFVTFLHGKQENRWTGADPAALRGNVRLLVQMAWPQHPHQSLAVPSFRAPDLKPVLYTKVPPMAKLLVKMGDETANDPVVQSLKRFIEERARNGPAQAELPDMVQTGAFVRRCVQSLPPALLFAVVDLFRCSMADPRFSGYFAEEKEHKTVLEVLNLVNRDTTGCPYALRLVTLQMACNFFSTPLYSDRILGDDVLRGPVIQLISSSFLDDGHSNVRVAASSLTFNLALASREARRSGAGSRAAQLNEEDQVELAASLVEAIGQEGESAEALQGMLLALGHLVYCTPVDGELADLLRTLDAEGTVLGKKKQFPGEKLVAEVGGELLGKGLRRP